MTTRSDKSRWKVIKITTTRLTTRDMNTEIAVPFRIRSNKSYNFIMLRAVTISGLLNSEMKLNDQKKYRLISSNYFYHFGLFFFFHPIFHYP